MRSVALCCFIQSRKRKNSAEVVASCEIQVLCSIFTCCIFHTSDVEETDAIRGGNWTPSSAAAPGMRKSSGGISTVRSMIPLHADDSDPCEEMRANTPDPTLSLPASCEDVVEFTDVDLTNNLERL